jgi:hypothetical protein
VALAADRASRIDGRRRPLPGGHDLRGAHHHRYQTVLDVMKAVMKTLAPSFRTADGKALLTGNSLRVAILRELKKPDLAGRVEMTRDRYKNGRPMVLIRRRQ